MNYLSNKLYYKNKGNLFWQYSFSIGTCMISSFEDLKPVYKRKEGPYEAERNLPKISR